MTPPAAAVLSAEVDPGDVNAGAHLHTPHLRIKWMVQRRKDDRMLGEEIRSRGRRMSALKKRKKKKTHT